MGEDVAPVMLFALLPEERDRLVLLKSVRNPQRPGPRSQAVRIVPRQLGARSGAAPSMRRPPATQRDVDHQDDGGAVDRGRSSRRHNAPELRDVLAEARLVLVPGERGAVCQPRASARPRAASTDLRWTTPVARPGGSPPPAEGRQPRPVDDPVAHRHAHGVEPDVTGAAAKIRERSPSLASVGEG